MSFAKLINMPYLVQYILKLSLSLSLVYLFYEFVLRRLTFYNWNRFYLIIYTILSFFIPLINIAPVLERNEMLNSKVVSFIPSINNVHEGSSANYIPGKVHHAISWSPWDVVPLVIMGGMIVMILRLLIQFLSFRKMIRQCELVSDAGVRYYQVNKAIIPFSFGKSIFINPALHNEEELKEIVRHEFVHVRQKHTIDIVWAEVLCILNWYNPFTWVIRKAIRQNLEFIADNKVLQAGIDKRQYQYLLLKVTGNNHFSIASQFNFSSLKKRIAMMNKMKSAKVHLVKFLFVLPVVAVMLVAFRSNSSDTKKDKSGKDFDKGFVHQQPNRMSTGYDSIPVNNKGYILDVINDEKNIDIVTVKNIKGKKVKEILLTEWNRNKKYYEDLYGKGVDEVIENAVKRSMQGSNAQISFSGSVNLANTREMWFRWESFERNDVMPVDTTTFTADTLIWSAAKKQLYFKGNVSIEDQRNGRSMTMNLNLAALNINDFYITLNGKELVLTDDYINYAKSAYRLISLSKGRSFNKYGNKAKNGALEIISLNL